MEQSTSPPRKWWEWIRCFFPRSGQGAHSRAEGMVAELQPAAEGPTQQGKGMRAGRAGPIRSSPDSLLRRSPRLRRLVVDQGSDADPEILHGGMERMALRKDTERRRTRRGGQFYIDPALTWSFVRKAHGWDFVDDSSWVVSAPSSTRSNARPIQLAQVSSYVAGDRHLRKGYEEWLETIHGHKTGQPGGPSRDVDSDDGDDDDGEGPRESLGCLPTTGTTPARPAGRRCSHSHRNHANANTAEASASSCRGEGNGASTVGTDAAPRRRGGTRRRRRAIPARPDSRDEAGLSEPVGDTAHVRARARPPAAAAAAPASATGKTRATRARPHRIRVNPSSEWRASVGGGAGGGGERGSVPIPGASAPGGMNTSGNGVAVVSDDAEENATNPEACSGDDVSSPLASPPERRERRSRGPKASTSGSSSRKRVRADPSGVANATSDRSTAVPLQGASDARGGQEDSRGAASGRGSHFRKRRARSHSSDPSQARGGDDEAGVEAGKRAGPSSSRSGMSVGEPAAAGAAGSIVSRLGRRRTRAPMIRYEGSSKRAGDPLEVAGAPSSLKTGHSGATPSEAERGRRVRRRREGAGASGRSEHGGDDPLEPYARIERETVSDEGLDELLHNRKRTGYLDLRKHSRPGFARPIRATYLEVNHGKRFLGHLKELLEKGKRVEANVFLRKLRHYDQMPPQLTAAAGKGLPCIPAWYQALAGATESVCVEEVFDLTSAEVEVIDCGDDIVDDVSSGAAPSAVEPKADSRAKRKGPPKCAEGTRLGTEVARGRSQATIGFVGARVKVEQHH